MVSRHVGPCVRSARLISGTALALLAALFVSVAVAQTSSTAFARTIWRLLDYIAVDYPEAVQNGQIVSQAEYDEMREFSSTVTRLLAGLAPSAQLDRLKHDAVALEGLIAAKAPPQGVASAARGLAARVIDIYPVPRAPKTAPDLARGEELYGQLCSYCHGATGRADGELAARLDPRPIAFTDRSRARERSVFALYQVIEQGLEGTSMSSFAHLPSQDRWALAFYVGSLGFPGEDSVQGKALWEGDPRLRNELDLPKLVGTTPASVAAELGEDRANLLVAYLRRHPEVVSGSGSGGGLLLARTQLANALVAYEAGDREQATRLALSAYLDGFEPLEAALSVHDGALMRRIETAMAELREGIADRVPLATVKQQVDRLDALFFEAERTIEGGAPSDASSFLAAFVILVREGLEALLLVLAFITFLGKSERRDLLVYVHGGWIAALVAGAITWALATWLITISGATRELTEGIGGVAAAFVLLWVGVWMHGKSHANAWQRYIREKLGGALGRRSAWFLFALAFVVVYREVFETILFYSALTSQGGVGAVAGGALSAVAVLAILTVLLLRYSRSLPIGKFFAYSAALMSVLAVVLIGKGTAALQEAGYLPVTPWRGFIRIDVLGVFPTRETVASQLVMIAFLTAGFLWNRRSRET